MYKDKKIVSPLPAMFICCVLFIAVLNMKLFFTSYDKAIENNPNNKQLALSSIETSYTDSFAGKTNYLDLNGLFSLMLDKKELNERYRLNNGYLTDTISIFSERTSAINNLTNLKEYLEMYDIPFAYVQTPHTIPTDGDPMIPFGYETHINGNSDRLLAGLQENNVNYLDLREKVVADGLDNYDLFFATDHHWNFEGAFWAHQHVAEFIDNQLGQNFSTPEYFDINNFNINTIEKSFLGRDGERTGIFYGGLDDITIITPKSETNYKVEITGRNWNRSGNFEEVFLEYSYSELKELKPYSSNNYCVYLDSNYNGYYKIENKLATNDAKIFIIKDSYSKPLSAFLSLHYAEIHMYQQGSQEELLEKLHEIQPDIVLQVRTSNDSLNAQAKAELTEYRNLKPNS